MVHHTTISEETEELPSSIPISLRDIASWHDIDGITEKPPIRASVPVLQRGLVWNPSQIELLWDSLLRGFPIGALVLSAKITGQQKESDAHRSDVTHHLLDGQQRCDAIALGFKDPFDASNSNINESILWLDLDPPEDPWSTREFMVRITTPSHPWGYQRGDNAAPLSAGSIRTALGAIDPSSETYKRPSPAELAPHVAVAPVPLAWLHLAAQGPDLWESIRRRLNNTKAREWCERLRKFLDDPEREPQRIRIGVAIKRMDAIRIVALCAPDDLLKSSRQEATATYGTDREDQENISSIEHLFQRLNQQGTRLDGEELAYSMIKAYWPELAGPINKIATMLPATRLISLGIRAALSNDDSKQLPNGMGVSGIRNLARKDNEKAHKVRSYISDDLGRGCERIKEWLCYDRENNPSGLLPVHIGSIARDSQDIFLLFLTFAKRPASDWDQDGLEWNLRLQALASLIHWFGRNKGSIANRIFAACTVRISLESIRNALCESIAIGDLRPIHSPDVTGEFLQVPKDNMKDWDWWQHIQAGETEEEKQVRVAQWNEFLWFRGQKELLLYAQRDFIHRRFPDYDPARKDFWKGHNRPWDFDHILAAKYLHYGRGDFKPVCDQWVGTIGNFRAWPFEDNRSDQAETAMQKLGGQKPEKEMMRKYSFVEADELPGFSAGDEVRWKEECAAEFIKACRGRLLRIYEEWYESVSVADLLPPESWVPSAKSEP